jgi:hypothetical protein
VALGKRADDFFLSLLCKIFFPDFENYFEAGFSGTKRSLRLFCLAITSPLGKPQTLALGQSGLKSLSRSRRKEKPLCESWPFPTTFLLIPKGFKHL